MSGRARTPVPERGRLAAGSSPEDVQRYLFEYRKSDAITSKARDALMRPVRLTGDELDGYVPSYAIGRSLDAAAGWGAAMAGLGSPSSGATGSSFMASGSTKTVACDPRHGAA